MARTDDTPPVVVGYDGSTESQRALRWAVEEARRRWTSLVICHAWHWPYPARPSDPALLETFEVLARGVRTVDAVADVGDLGERLEPVQETRGHVEVPEVLVVEPERLHPPERR